MKKMTPELTEQFNDLFEMRKNQILNAPDQITVSGMVYYVSNAGDDQKDGRTPETAWKTLKKVSETVLHPGDGVLFRRGDLFRGSVLAKEGVTYAAYGEGEKPVALCHKLNALACRVCSLGGNGPGASHLEVPQNVAGCRYNRI